MERVGRNGSRSGHRTVATGVAGVSLGVALRGRRRLLSAKKYFEFRTTQCNIQMMYVGHFVVYVLLKNTLRTTEKHVTYTT